MLSAISLHHTTGSLAEWPLFTRGAHLMHLLLALRGSCIIIPTNLRAYTSRVPQYHCCDRRRRLPALAFIRERPTRDLRHMAGGQRRCRPSLTFFTSTNTPYIDARAHMLATLGIDNAVSVSCPKNMAAWLGFLPSVLFSSLFTLNIPPGNHVIAVKVGWESDQGLGQGWGWFHKASPVMRSTTGLGERDEWCIL